MRFKLYTRSFALAIILTSGTALSAATTIYDNSGSAWTSNMSVSSYFYQAQSFRSGSEVTYLHTVSLGLLANDGTDAPFFVQIYDGLYPGLGTPIATLEGPTNPGAGMIAYSPSSSILLAADTTYWVLARAYGATALGSPYGWRIADEEPTAGIDSGRNMYYADGVNQWVGPTGPGDFVMTVTVIPEPSASLLLALSSLALVTFRRRTKEGRTEQDEPQQPLSAALFTCVSVVSPQPRDRHSPPLIGVRAL
jgi:hypothetical protein